MTTNRPINQPANIVPTNLYGAEVEVAGLETVLNVVKYTAGLDTAAEIAFAAKWILDSEAAAPPLLLLVGQLAAPLDADHQIRHLEAAAEEREELNPELGWTELVLRAPGCQSRGGRDVPPRVPLPGLQHVVDAG